MATALDYSAGRPSGAAVKAARHAGVVRYAGTPGRTKNITRAEFLDMDRNGIGVALVFEDAAGDALKGWARGVTAAKAIAADAAAIGFPASRPLYFAVDQDITNQMDTVKAYFGGIASVLGSRPIGVYGEADVLDDVMGAGLAEYGWQTVAWSRGRAAKTRHLFQHAGYSYVGGIQVDVNDILAADWGQHNAQEDDMPDEATFKAWVSEVIDSRLEAIRAGTRDTVRWEFFATPHDPADPRSFTPVGGRSPADMVAEILNQVFAANAKADALAAVVAELASDEDITPEKMQEMLNVAVARSIQVSGELRVTPVTAPAVAQ